MAVYYKGMKTTDSVLNTTTKNAVIIAPNGQNFSLNISGAFLNPDELVPFMETWVTGAVKLNVML